MSRAIREHLRDFLAIIVLIVAGVVTAFVHPRQPGDGAAVLGADPRRGPLRAQGRVHLGPGRHARARARRSTIAGIKVGDITGVELDERPAPW